MYVAWNTIICKIIHDAGSESAVAQMVRLRFGLAGRFKFKPRIEFSLSFFLYIVVYRFFLVITCSFLSVSVLGVSLSLGLVLILG